MGANDTKPTNSLIMYPSFGELGKSGLAEFPKSGQLGKSRGASGSAIFLDLKI